MQERGMKKIEIFDQYFALSWKYKIELYLEWPINRKSYMVYRTAPFSMTLNDRTPMFQGHAIFFDAECLINGTRYRYSFNEILIGAYTRPTQQCHFE